MIHIQEFDKLYVEIIRLKLEWAQKHSFFLKKANSIKLIGFDILVLNISIKEKMFEVNKIWLELKSIRDILVFLDFAYFYKRLIKNFSRIITPFISIFQTTNKIVKANFVNTG